MPYPVRETSAATSFLTLATSASDDRPTWTDDYEAPGTATSLRERSRGMVGQLRSGLPQAPQSMREQHVRSGWDSSSTFLALGMVGGTLGALTAISVTITAILGLLSDTPVYPFNPHGGVHRAPAYALIGCTAGLVIPAAGFFAGALTFGGVALLATCIFY